MQPQSDSDYKKIFTELIRKQMVVLGPDITLAKVKNVQGIQINEQGEVVGIQGDPQSILQLLINQFVELSGLIVKKTMESILTTYPGMAGIATSAIAGNVSTPPQQVTPVNQPQNVPTDQPKVMGANPFSDAVFSQNNTGKTQSDNEAAQLPKEDMDSINKALTELSKSPIPSQAPSPLETNTDNVQQSNSN